MKNLTNLSAINQTIELTFIPRVAEKNNIWTVNQGKKNSVKF